MHSGHKVYVFYDHPHLVMNVGNNLKKHGFNVDGNLVQWKHIEDFYRADSKFPIRMAPKLMHKHIELQPFAPLSIKLATQVLSHSVAAGISTTVSLGALPEGAQHTAVFVLFDSYATVSKLEKQLDTNIPDSGALPHPWGIAPTHWVWKHHVQFLPSGDD